MNKFQLEKNLKIFAKITVIIATMLLGDITSYEVIDRSSDKYFDLISHRITVQDVALRCFEWKFISVPLLLVNKQCQFGPFAYCVDETVHKLEKLISNNGTTVTNKSLIKYNNLHGDFHSIVDNITTTHPPYCAQDLIRPLQHPMEVVAPGIIT